MVGGDDNAAKGIASTVGGGQYNKASADYSTVGGGQYNQASAEYSTIPGGYLNSLEDTTKYVQTMINRCCVVCSCCAHWSWFGVVVVVVLLSEFGQ